MFNEASYQRYRISSSYPKKKHLLKLTELQIWTKELGYKKCILETGDKMIEAIGLYKKHNFKIIRNYGQYATIEDSICFEKKFKTFMLKLFPKIYFELLIAPKFSE